MKILLTLQPVIDWISQFMVKQVRVNIKQLPLWVLACSAPVEPGKASKMALKCSKCMSFRGRCPLDPRQGLCPWTPPGPLSGPLDPRPWGARATLTVLATLRIFSGPIMLGHLHPWYKIKLFDRYKGYRIYLHHLSVTSRIKKKITHCINSIILLRPNNNFAQLKNWSKYLKSLIRSLQFYFLSMFFFCPIFGISSKLFEILVWKESWYFSHNTQ